ncbi:hypothetical protein CCMSSC00406_0005785 [Pleurotus cornucopiae]|uniref:Uncharacterized protein n=1 Tax=Pleurotus cornucopiae TaxID=5321 RepID=A0ACB7J9K0_PLECO|nr:hypothetical protein CCMSSC00406_0005785 [Pleurotus cornucopiae]
MSPSTPTTDDSLLPAKLHPDAPCTPRVKQLPIELIHHVVELLAEPDRDRRIPRAWTTCSRVCRTWNRICRHHIFRSILVYARRDGAVASRLNFLHFTASHLAEYILDLHLTFHEADLAKVPGWLPDCFKRFKNLRKLHIGCYATLPSPFAALQTLGITSLLAAGRIQSFEMESYELIEDDSGLLPILSLCSATLEEVKLRLCVDRPGVDLATFPHWKPEPRDQSTVRLDALRKLDFEEDLPRLHETNRIECPNLESLTITRSNHGPWVIPSWIPASLRGLVLKVSEKLDIPQFVTSIRPSRLTIEIYKLDRGSYRSVLAWIKDCIDHLPSPNDLRQLTIRIKVYCFHPIKVFDYPTHEDHQELYRVIEPLHRHGVLERVKLEFATENWRFKPIPTDRTREIVTMQEVFAPLLEGGRFAVDTEHWE